MIFIVVITSLKVPATGMQLVSSMIEVETTFIIREDILREPELM